MQMSPDVSDLLFVEFVGLNILSENWDVHDWGMDHFVYPPSQ